MTDERKPTLAARLLAVMGEVGYIQKQGKTDSGPRFNYVRHDDVVATLRPALVKHGVAFLASTEEDSVGCEQVGITKSGAARYKTTLMLRLTFMSTDDPGDAYSVSFPGEGVDTEDKGSGKALSYALKNGLLKVFMIEAGDDADVERGAEPAVSQATRRDEQAETPQPSPLGQPAAGHITRTQARDLHAMLHAKGRESQRFLSVLAGKGIGDGEHLTSIPADQYEALTELVRDFADPETVQPRAQAAAPGPAEPESGDESTSEAPDAPDAGPDPEPPGMDAEAYRAKRAADAEASAPKPRTKGTVSAAQLTRLGAQAADLERLGVGEAEWRTYLFTNEGVRSRKDLTKASATRMIDAFAAWITDLETVGERVKS